MPQLRTPLPTYSDPESKLSGRTLTQWNMVTCNSGIMLYRRTFCNYLWWAWEWFGPDSTLKCIHCFLSGVTESMKTATLCKKWLTVKLLMLQWCCNYDVACVLCCPVCERTIHVFVFGCDSLSHTGVPFDGARFNMKVIFDGTHLAAWCRP